MGVKCSLILSRHRGADLGKVVNPARKRKVVMHLERKAPGVAASGCVAV